MGSHYRYGLLGIMAGSLAFAAAPAIAGPAESVRRERARGERFIRCDHDATRSKPQSDSLRRLLRAAKR